MSLPTMTDNPWLPLAAGSGTMAVLGVVELAADNWFQGLSNLGVAGGMIGLWYYNIRYRDPQIAKTNADAVERVGEVMAGSIDRLREQIKEDNREFQADLRENQAHLFRLVEASRCPTHNRQE